MQPLGNQSNLVMHDKMRAPIWAVLVIADIYAYQHASSKMKAPVPMTAGGNSRDELRSWLLFR